MSTFSPDWTSAPGDTIQDILDQRDISQAGFGEMVRLPRAEVEALLQGRQAITLEVARQLSAVLGATPEFWMARDFQFRETAATLGGMATEWARQLPLGDMVRFGWMAPPHPTEEVRACLNFFGVPSVAAWRSRYEATLATAAFRTSPAFESRPAALAAWLRQGEREAAEIMCDPWAPDLLAARLPLLRRLSKVADPQRFLPKLRAECARAGVAVVVVRSPAGNRASGAVRFVSSDKAVVQLSARFLTDDQFWFSFFHECGHLLLHLAPSSPASRSSETPILDLEGGSEEEPREGEASRFAQTMIIPQEFADEFERLTSDAPAVIRFAVRVGVSPGLVVGQLQYRRRLAYDRLNRLKRRYAWS
ncbi:MAG: ImmA/IrrE family metallo-endopeptidase [Chloroflexi bacterium]|nr:ImmA/IrrE family metallo-endopeptidase [Chloroflexota bacterium]PWB46532.1 MAG: hypothetical protein C3F10_04840 [Dehalococcoidia bacterium]